MDVGVNKPFKGYMREEFEKCMVEEEDGAKPKRHHVATFISRSWNRVTEQTITNTWARIISKVRLIEPEPWQNDMYDLADW